MNEKEIYRNGLKMVSLWFARFEKKSEHESEANRVPLFYVKNIWVKQMYKIY